MIFLFPNGINADVTMDTMGIQWLSDHNVFLVPAVAAHVIQLPGNV